MYKYNIFDEVKLNLKKLPNVNDELIKMCENERYCFYKYKPDDIFKYTYILGQLKCEPKSVIMLGENYDNAIVFKNSLFLFNKSGELNRSVSFIHRLDLENHIEETYNLRQKFGKWQYMNGFGRLYTTDYYVDVEVLDDEMIIYCHREKSNEKEFLNDKNNCDLNYKIIFQLNNNKFIPYYNINNKIYELDNYDCYVIKKIYKKDNKIVFFQTMDKITIFCGALMLLFIIVGLVASLLTRFHNSFFLILLFVGIFGFLICDIISRIVNNHK